MSLRALAIVLSFTANVATASDSYRFSEKDRSFLGSLSINRVDPPKGLAGNEVLYDLGAAELGKKIFFDKRFSKNGAVACATCHDPKKYFTDGLPQSVGIGQTTRNAPSILLSAWSPWQFWDGRKDSMWSQALGPLEDPKEHGISRREITHLVMKHYSGDYQKVFSDSVLKSNNAARIFANVGKVLMAYQFRLKLQPSRFDQFVELIAKNNVRAAKNVFSKKEVAGLRLFAGKANCISCHNGPLLSNFEFHNVGVPEFNKEKVDLGRFSGVKILAKDEFTCLSKYSSAKPEECLEMKFLKTSGPELVGAFKTPSLRNVAMTAPYMHSGQFATLADVVNHYNKPKPPFYDRAQHPNRPHFDILPLRLTEEEKSELVAFLATLTSPLPRKDRWWFANSVGH